MARRVKSTRRKMTRKSKSKPKRRGLSSRAKKISEILSTTLELPKISTKSKKSKKAPKKSKKTKKGMTYKSFVKANFKKVQAEMPGSPAPEIIKAVAAEWKKINTDGKSSVQPAPPKKTKKKKKKSKTKTDNRPVFKP
tara:strand:+ start:243 stop:656 length:414 start_codon:yes stop_codon:yes gene_type:complete